MKPKDLILIIHKHLVLLVLTPLAMALLVILLTARPHYKYASQTTLYTGIATGSSVEMDKSFNFFATTTAFDNLINIVKSRETQQEVAIRLLSQHLLLDSPDPKYISAASFEELRRITPDYIYKLVIKTPADDDSTVIGHGQPVISDTASELFPPSINRSAYEQTYRNLTFLMQSNDTNFVYKLLNYPNPHYSFKDISSIKVQRMANSDLVQLHYETDDPGVCQQTLALMNEVCIRNYKDIKENSSDAVVKYFETQLGLAAVKLKVAEEKLLAFNKDNNIINYYEQSKAVAVVKEDLEVAFNEKKMKLAGAEAAIGRLEEKLNLQQQIQLKSGSILDKKKELGEINYKIAMAETISASDSNSLQNVNELRRQAENLKIEIRGAVSELYAYGNSIDGLPVTSVLQDWISNVIEAENIKAGLMVLSDRIQEFQKQYAIYAPAGANIKRIEREISVSEQEYLEILHGLNLAKLKMQDIELSSNIKAVDSPYYPLSPIPTKRKILVIIAALFGFMIVLGSILFMEYFDNTLNNGLKASQILKSDFLGVFPKIFIKHGTTNFPFILNRLLDIAIQNIDQDLKASQSGKSFKSILVFSTLNQEGKTAIASNLARKYMEMGKKVLYLEHTDESNTLMTGNGENMTANSNARTSKRRFIPSILSRLLGYQDPQIDLNSPFLDHPQNSLGKEEYFKFKTDYKFRSIKSVEEFLELNGIAPSGNQDIVIIELPAILYHSYPVELYADTDAQVMVCRANRSWSEADRTAVESIVRVNGRQPKFILNGAKLDALELVIGEIPKNRSWVRRKAKAVLQLQFYSQNQI